ncbi:hypothetical protein [Algibacter mikhailovii]|uniref:hypothetical protein n=1 Tax=Algibacter mikhailovii TaxID=425498 RepID=UPI0024954F78|nr:hypothetical protein [Algibacter mikhailovii]
MNKTIKFISISLIGILILTSLGLQNESKILFHKIRFTASSVELEKWNIKDTIGTAFVMETIDNYGRTKELRFYNWKHQLDWAGSGFYGGPIIKYDYEKNKVIETFFSSDNDIANDFKTSEVPYRHIYLLNEKNQIVDIKRIYKIDFEWTQKNFEETIKHLEFYKQYPDEGSELNNVFGFDYAYAKMNGINPERKK